MVSPMTPGLWGWTARAMIGGPWALGKRRAALGYPQPFGVTYWEVGNEVYDKNEIGFASARRYAQDFVAFAQAMKSVDPHIKVGAVGLTSPRGRGDADPTDAWNPMVIKTTEDYLDFLIIHPYYPAGGQERVFYQGEPWFPRNGRADQAMADLREIRKVIAANSLPRKTPRHRSHGVWHLARGLKRPPGLCQSCPGRLRRRPPLGPPSEQLRTRHHPGRVLESPRQ